MRRFRRHKFPPHRGGPLGHGVEQRCPHGSFTTGSKNQRFLSEGSRLERPGNIARSDPGRPARGAGAQWKVCAVHQTF